MKVAVLSAPGRDEQSYRCLSALTKQNPGVPFWVYRSDLPDPIGEFWELLYAARGDDLLALEDDIVTARNFFKYADRWGAPCVTSFFHAKRPVLGAPVSAEGFSFCQAVKIPRYLVDELCRMGHGPRSGGQDDALGRQLQQLAQPVIYHRSLVQHVGAASFAWGSKVTLEHRVALDYPGDDFDCLTLP